MWTTVILNKVMKPDAYPLPNISHILNKLGGNSYYSTIDLHDAFWSIPIDENDIEKTAFIAHNGLWKFISMPFGLTNAPATQQRFIESILTGLTWQTCMAYVDDIVIFLKTFEEHLLHINQVLTRLQEYKVMIAPEKCSFCLLSFKILGHTCIAEGTVPNSSKIDLILNYPKPHTKDELT